jgi:hypothetical protein
MSSNSYEDRSLPRPDLAVTGALVVAAFLVFPYTGCGSRSSKLESSVPDREATVDEIFFENSTNDTSEKPFEGTFERDNPTRELAPPSLEELLE